MRSEKEMLDLIVSTGLEDIGIKGAYLGGSRVNPAIPKDIFQDYDVVYVVDSTAPYRENKQWIDRFGERMYMQYPEESAFEVYNHEECYGWLMQFLDGNRLDLHVCTPRYLPQWMETDKLYKVLFDKDGCLPKTDKYTEESYLAKNLTQEQFLGTANEFWWCMNNVAKGLWREEIPYTMDMLNYNVRPMLARLLEFKVGLETDFTAYPGKSLKYLGRYLDNRQWETYHLTFPAGKVKDIWNAVFVMCDLFDEVAKDIAIKTGYFYNTAEAINSRKYLEHVNKLPKDAESVYP